jgi:hypothetical protein
MPNGLTTGPLTGQMSPLAEGVVSLEPLEEYVTDDWAAAACAERI